MTRTRFLSLGLQFTAVIATAFFLAPHTSFASTEYDTAVAQANALSQTAQTDNDKVLAASPNSAGFSALVSQSSTAHVQAAAAFLKAAQIAAQDAKAATDPANTKPADTATALNGQAIAKLADQENQYASFIGLDAATKTKVLADQSQIRGYLAQADTAAATAATASGDTARATADTQKATNASNEAAGKQSCQIDNLPQCFQDFISWIIERIALAFLFLAAFFAGLAGFLFNWIIYITVFQFGNLIGNNPGLLAAWGVLRDIGNILLLFGFIFMGISTILNLPGNEFTAKRALPAFIIFAVLMNFSLFAAESIIDVSNALGTTLYKQSSNGLCTEGDFMQCATQQGIAGSIFKVSGIAAIFDPNAPTQISDKNGLFAYLIVALGLTLFAAVAAFVFLAAVIMFITRAVVLAFLMATSPIGFAGMAVPPLHELASRWWSEILKQSFFAPIYILLILISIKFMEGVTVALNAVSGGGNISSLAAAFSQTGASNVSMIINFLLIIGFMMGSVIIAKQMGALGADRATGMAGAAVFGGMARITNFGVGGTARLFRYGVQQTAGRSNNQLVRSLGSSTSSFLKGVEKSNTDLRKTPVVGGLIAQQAGGPAEHASYSDIQHQIHEVRAGLQADRADFEKDVAKQRFVREAKGGAGALSAESQRYLANLSAEQISADHDLQHSIEHLADALSPDQFEGIMKNEKVTQNVKDNLSANRFQQIRAAIDPANGGYGNSANREAVRALSNKDLEMLAKYDTGTFNTLVAMGNTGPNGDGDSMISSDQSDHLGKSSALTTVQRGSVYSNSRKGRVEAEIRNGNIATAARYTNAMSSKAKAKLNNSTLVHAGIVSTYTAGDLAEIQREGKLDANQVSQIAQQVRNNNHPNNQAITNWLNGNANADSYWR
jgi:hypothetical protein